ncbi:hypothetical protein ACQPXH_15310 [Nocardia sp. CA-135953]|uniref:hypothetical protein n=1 Tax=Nocardia sp. CA-135953 TaxID=3239978 RepID=UPI003D99E3E6
MSEQSVVQRRIDWTRWSFLQWAVFVIGATLLAIVAVQVVRYRGLRPVFGLSQ